LSKSLIGLIMMLEVQKNYAAIFIIYFVNDNKRPYMDPPFTLENISKRFTYFRVIGKNFKSLFYMTVTNVIFFK